VNLKFWKKRFPLSFWKEYIPFSIESLILAAVIIIICCFGYGVKTTLIYSCLILSVFSDGLLVNYVRLIIFRKRYNPKYVKGEHKAAIIYFIASAVLHAVTYYYLGKYSFVLVFPTIVLLAMIYLMFVYNKRKDKNR